MICGCSAYSFRSINRVLKPIVSLVILYSRVTPL
ncbi:hypothetical protein Lp16_F001 (plasmid) [Lactiplantibacillus plantarum 16]|nr:hypothetical protein Lp16_F001 [Lactiplantibacillus plantarum 16]